MSLGLGPAATALAAATMAFAAPQAAATSTPLVLGTADPAYLSTDVAEREQLFDLTSDLGGPGLVRFNANWKDVAPTEPTDGTDPADAAYNFERLDTAMRSAAARGLQTLITTNRTPVWAQAPGPQPEGTFPNTWKPDAVALGEFSEAIATRYSGSYDLDGPGPEPPLPEVDFLQAFNEPNLGRFLAPQFGTDNEGNVSTAAERYREMLNASYDGFKAPDPTNQVVIAGTAPLESVPGVRTGPVTFLRRLFCLDNKSKAIPVGQCERVHFDVFDHHAITPRDPSKPGISDGARLADYSKLTKLLRAAEQQGTVLPAAAKPRPLWTTEIYWETNPPDTATGSPLKSTTVWMQQGLRLLHEQGVELALNFFMHDLGVTEPGEIGNVQGGLAFEDLTLKSQYTAYRFPLDAERLSKKKVSFFARAPAAGKLKVQAQGLSKKNKKKWTTLFNTRVQPGDVVTKKVKVKKAKKKPYAVRAKLPGESSLTGKLK